LLAFVALVVMTSVAAPISLSAGSVSHIYTTKDTSSKPVVQVVELKQITASNATGSPRYRLAVSDGKHYQQAMLATQLNSLVADGSLQVHTVIRMNDFIANEVANKRIIIILNVDVMSSSADKIGTPVSVDTLGIATPAAATPVRGATFRAGTGESWNATSMTPKQPSGVSPTGVFAAARTGMDTRYRDIRSVNPYLKNWIIKGRCTFKSDVRMYTNAKGDGKLMSFELTDNSGSIRVTCFNEQVDTANPKVHVGRVYTVSKAQLKQANEKYNRSTSEYEMTLGRESELLEDSDDGTVAQIKYNFTKIAQLETVEVKGLCDVVAIVHEIQPLTEITIRSTGDNVTKRSLTLVDDSGATVEMTLWRTAAETLVTEADIDRHPVIILRGALRGDFGGVCLNVSRSTTVELDPTTIPEANALRGWYDAGGVQAASIQSLSESSGSKSNKVLGDRKSLAEADAEDVQPALQSGAPATFAMRGYVSFMKKDRELSYPSDPETKKKLTEAGVPGMWHSESTGREYTDEQIQHRYICSMKVSDFSDSKWLTAFDEAGQVVLGRSAVEMRSLRAEDVNMYENIIDDCFFRPIVIKVQAKQDEWNGETRIKYVMQRVQAVDFVSESRALLSEIQAYGV
jgi:replication factor A1